MCAKSSWATDGVDVAFATEVAFIIQSLYHPGREGPSESGQRTQNNLATKSRVRASDVHQSGRDRRLVALRLNALSIVRRVKLDVYRSCSRAEKRQVLDAYWRTSPPASARVHDAAFQYGPYAILSLVAIALELALVIVVAIDRAVIVCWLAVLLEVVVVLSTWWALVRFRALRPENP